MDIELPPRPHLHGKLQETLTVLLDGRPPFNLNSFVVAATLHHLRHCRAPRRCFVFLGFLKLGLLDWYLVKYGCEFLAKLIKVVFL